MVTIEMHLNFSQESDGKLWGKGFLGGGIVWRAKFVWWLAAELGSFGGILGNKEGRVKKNISFFNKLYY